jgi:hypothetical protein
MNRFIKKRKAPQNSIDTPYGVISGGFRGLHKEMCVMIRSHHGEGAQKADGEGLHKVKSS